MRASPAAGADAAADGTRQCPFGRKASPGRPVHGGGRSGGDRPTGRAEGVAVAYERRAEAISVA
jgi:hypothetical protein